jgi:heme-degrading monooxygenase HmoA
MIVEIGLWRIDASLGDFTPIADDIRDAFSRLPIPGLRSFHIGPSVEEPARWVVVVVWDTVEDHRTFVASPEGVRQRELLAPFIVGDPDVMHYELPGVKEGMR